MMVLFNCKKAKKVEQLLMTEELTDDVNNNGVLGIAVLM